MTRIVQINGYMPPAELYAQTLWFCVIYDDPSDFPGHVVMRTQCPSSLNDVATAPYCGVYESVEEARKDVPKSGVNIGRYEQDDSKIVEVWLL